MIDVHILFEILIEWAESGAPKTYTDLSNAYQEKTGEWHEPHGSWDAPLGRLNNRLAGKGAPAISSLVILKGANEPGGNFWGCAPNVPERPREEKERLAALNKIWTAVFNYDWRKYAQQEDAE